MTFKPFKRVTGDEVEGLISPDATETASESDRAWFEENPGAEVRYRTLVPGELPLPLLPDGIEEQLPTDAFQVEVVQLEPGMRVRQIAWVDLEGLKA